MKLLGDLGQRPSLPGHAIACCGFKTSIVMLPVAMLKARATSNTSFAMKSLLSLNARAPAEADARFTQSLVRAVMVAGPPIRATRGHGAMP